MWSKLLSPLRMEPTPEADFESRFIGDFHRRLKQEPVRVSLLSRIRNRVGVFMADFAGRRWAAAATTALGGAVVVGALMWPQADVPKAVASVGTPVSKVAEKKIGTVSETRHLAGETRVRVMAAQTIEPIHADDEESVKDEPTEIAPEPAAE